MSPGVISPAVMNPAVISPMVRNPVVINPVVIRPAVVSLAVSSPAVISLTVISPAVMKTGSWAAYRRPIYITQIFLNINIGYFFFELLTNLTQARNFMACDFATASKFTQYTGR